MPTKRFAAVAMAALLTFTVAACGGGDNASGTTTTPEDVIVPDAQVTSGLAATQKLMADIQSAAATDTDQRLTALEDGWAKYEGTIKTNDAALYLDFEDALAGFRTAVKAKNATDAAAAATKFKDTATSYLAKRPG